MNIFINLLTRANVFNDSTEYGGRSFLVYGANVSYDSSKVSGFLAYGANVSYDTSSKVSGFLAYATVPTLPTILSLETFATIGTKSLAYDSTKSFAYVRCLTDTDARQPYVNH